MKLLRYGLLGQERPGLLDSDSRIRDLSRDVADIGPDCLTSVGLAGLAKLDPRSLPLVDQDALTSIPRRWNAWLGRAGRCETAGGW